MKCSVYVKKVKESKEYKEFMKEDPKAFLCSLFFTRDFLEKREDTQVDFYSIGPTACPGEWRSRNCRASAARSRCTT